MKKIISINSIDLSSDMGDAHSIRLSLLHKGFLEENLELDVFSYNVNYDTTIEKKKGYIFKSLKKKNKIVKYFYLLVINPLIFFIFLLKKVPKHSVILTDKIHFNLILPFILFKMIRRNKVIGQYYEFFVIHVRPTKKIQVFLLHLHFFLLKILLNYIDVLIVISDKHRDYFKKYMTKQSKIIVVPILVEYENYEIQEKCKERPFKVCYGGAISESNGIEVLIQAVRNITGIELKIFGFCVPVYKEKLIKKYGVAIEDSKENSVAKKIYQQQDLLVIPKIKDERAAGYIPSKLADYFLSGNPVLSTNVGDMPNYITDGENGFLVKPDDIDEMRLKIENIMGVNKKTLESIGYRGYLSAKQFDYRNQINKILELV